MRVVNIKGVIIPSDYGWIYDLFGIENTSPKKVTDALAEAAGEDIEVHINSGGGSVFAGAEIYSALISYTGNIKIKIVGLAGSAASMAATAGYCEISPAGMIMIHNCSGSAEGDYRDMYGAGNQLQQINRTIANTYIAKTGMSQEELLGLMDDETWMTPQEALEYGFVDAIMENANGLDNSTIVESRQMVVSNSCFEIPENVIKSFQGLMAAGRLDDIGGMRMKDKEKGMKTGGITGETGVVQNSNPMPKEEKTLEDFLSDHPEEKNSLEAIVNEAVQKAIGAERDRLKELDSIAACVPKEMLNRAKYEDCTDAKTLSFEVMKEGKIKAADYMKNAVEDSVASGISKIGANTPETPEGEEAGSASRIADSANKGRRKIKFI